MHRLRTVDVWDTLLRRACHPEAVKLATAQHVMLCLGDQLADQSADHWGLYESRCAIESVMAREAEAAGHDGEYELTAVIRRWLRIVLDASWQGDLDAVVMSVAEAELAFEMRHTFPDPEIASVMAAHPARTTLYLSDFYMTAPMLDRLLAHHGLHALVPGGLVSCDVMLNKRSGRLFHHLHAAFGVMPRQHVHIGDNPHSDVDVPHRLGVTAVAYLPQRGHAEKQSRDALFATRDDLFDRMRIMTRSAAEASMVPQCSDAAAMFDLGVQTAPLFIGFALFIAERSIRDRVDRLLFFTREGEFFLRLFETLFPEGTHAGHALAPRSVLAVSRQATFSASLEAVTLDEFDRIWSLNWQQRLSTLFGILDVDPSPFQPLLTHLGLTLDETIVRPRDDPRIERMLGDRVLAETILAQSRWRRALIRLYLLQQGVVPGDHVGVVDIGWRGSIQDNVARMSPECRTAGYYLALRAFLNPQPPNAIKHAFGPDERRDEGEDLFETFEPLELLCNSSSGSVTDYRLAGARVVAVRETNAAERDVALRFARPFQEGVLLAAKVQRPLLISHAVMSAEMRAMAFHIWRRLAAAPPEELIRAYYAAPQHDAFGFGGFFDRQHVPSLGTLLLAPVHRGKYHEVVQYIRRTQWRAALAGLNIGHLHRLVLASAFWLALHYKRRMILRKAGRRKYRRQQKARSVNRG